MKKIFFLLLNGLLLTSCKNTAQETKKSGDYASFGKTITNENALDKKEILEKYKSLKPGDTVVVKFKSNIQDVCQSKGCWMKLDIAEKQESFVKFKDYAFFMPKDSKGKEVIVNGKAFVSVVPVDELKHYAQDKGESKESIAAITEPKTTFSFLADGVLIKNTSK